MGFCSFLSADNELWIIQSKFWTNLALHETSLNETCYISALLTPAWSASCGSGSCPQGQICCSVGDNYGCCPPMSLCCSSFSNCCPWGYNCNINTGACSPHPVSRLIDWWLIDSRNSHKVNWRCWKPSNGLHQLSRRKLTDWWKLCAVTQQLCDFSFHSKKIYTDIKLFSILCWPASHINCSIKPIEITVKADYSAL